MQVNRSIRRQSRVAEPTVVRLAVIRPARACGAASWFLRRPGSPGSLGIPRPVKPFAVMAFS